MEKNTPEKDLTKPNFPFPKLDLSRSPNYSEGIPEYSTGQFRASVPISNSKSKFDAIYQPLWDKIKSREEAFNKGEYEKISKDVETHREYYYGLVGGYFEDEYRGGRHNAWQFPRYNYTDVTDTPTIFTCYSSTGHPAGKLGSVGKVLPDLIIEKHINQLVDIYNMQTRWISDYDKIKTNPNFNSFGFFPFFKIHKVPIPEIKNVNGNLSYDFENLKGRDEYVTAYQSLYDKIKNNFLAYLKGDYNEISKEKIINDYKYKDPGINQCFQEAVSILNEQIDWGIKINKLSLQKEKIDFEIISNSKKGNINIQNIDSNNSIEEFMKSILKELKEVKEENRQLKELVLKQQDKLKNIEEKLSIENSLNIINNEEAPPPLLIQEKIDKPKTEEKK